MRADGNWVQTANQAAGFILHKPRESDFAQMKTTIAIVPASASHTAGQQRTRERFLLRVQQVAEQLADLVSHSATEIGAPNSERRKT